MKVGLWNLNPTYDALTGVEKFGIETFSADHCGLYGYVQAGCTCIIV